MATRALNCVGILSSQEFCSLSCTLPDNIVCIFKLSSFSFDLLLKALLQLLKQPLFHHSILCRAVSPAERVRQNARKRWLGVLCTTILLHTHDVASLRSVSRQRFCLLYCLQNPLYLTRSTIGTDEVTSNALAPKTSRYGENVVANAALLLLPL